MFRVLEYAEIRLDDGRQAEGRGREVSDVVMVMAQPGASRTNGGHLHNMPLYWIGWTGGSMGTCFGT